VALLGTFTVMLLSGYSINILTMFGMVLAIGIIVDDAIVVVENVERLMEEKGLSRRRQRGKRCMKSRQQSLVLRWCLRRYLFRWRLPEGLSDYLSAVLYLYGGVYFTIRLSGADAYASTLRNVIKPHHHASRKGSAFSAWFNGRFMRLLRFTPPAWICSETDRTNDGALCRVVHGAFFRSVFITVIIFTG
jgi:multidrug efflux pump